VKKEELKETETAVDLPHLVQLFADVVPGTQFLRTDFHGNVDSCLKLRTHAGEWNTVYLSGTFAGGFCYTDDKAEIKLPNDKHSEPAEGEPNDHEK